MAISTFSTYIDKHFILCQRNLLQIHVSWAILEGEPVASALILEILLGPPAIAYDGSVNKVCRYEVGLLAIPITEDIVGVIGKVIIRIVHSVLFHNH